MNIFYFLFILLLSQTLKCATPLGPWKPGRSTYYTGIDDGACGYQQISQTQFPNRHIAAPNEAFFANSSACGFCYEIQCINSSYLANACVSTTVVIQVTDECPCGPNPLYCCGDADHFDLSQDAFAVIADINAGVINTQYRQVTCDTQGPVRFRIKDGTNPYWFAVLPFNIGGVGGLISVELQQNGSTVWQSMARQTYNYWLLTDSGNGLQTPFSLRTTLTNGTQTSYPNIIPAIIPNNVYPPFGSATRTIETLSWILVASIIYLIL